MTTDPNTLPQWNGHAVPWIARWTGEIADQSIKVSRSRDIPLMVGYEDGNENREASGILWMREGIGRRGEPEFGQVSAYRQRLAMTRRRCQVCGEKIQDEVIRWLVPNRLLHVLPDGRAITISAPTCSECIPLAMELCPFLKTAEVTTLRVLDYEVWGVMGDVVVLKDRAGNTVDPGDDVGSRPAFARQMLIEYGRESEYAAKSIFMSAVLAKQQVVHLTKFVKEKSE